MSRAAQLAHPQHPGRLVFSSCCVSASKTPRSLSRRGSVETVGSCMCVNVICCILSLRWGHLNVRGHPRVMYCDVVLPGKGQPGGTARGERTCCVHGFGGSALFTGVGRAARRVARNTRMWQIMQCSEHSGVVQQGPRLSCGHPFCWQAYHNEGLVAGWGAGGGGRDQVTC